MNKRFAAKSVIFLLVILLAIIQAACSSKQENSSASPQQSAADSGQKPSEAAKNTDPFGKFDPPIDIKFTKGTNDDVLKNVVKDDMKLESNLWTDAYAKELGINVSYNWISKSQDEFDQKTNLDIVSGNLPDVMVLSSAQAYQLAKEGKLADITDAYNNYASPLTQEIFKTFSPGDPFAGSRYNGQLVSLPVNAATAQEADMLWIRSDWLKKLNLNPPKSMDDVYMIAKAFAEQDPDGNGKKDTVGLSLMKDMASPVASLKGFFGGYHAYLDTWLEKNGQLENSNIQPEMKQALAKLSQMYKEGLISKEFGLKDFGKIIEDISQNKTGMMYGAFFIPLGFLEESYKKDKNADWNPYPLPSNDANPAMERVAAGSASVLAVRKGYAHPEALIKMINLYNKLYTEQPTQYGVQPDGRAVWKLSPLSFVRADQNLVSHKGIVEAVNSNDTSKLAPGAKDTFDKVKSFMDTGDSTNWAWNKIFGVGTDTQISMETIQTYIQNNLLIIDKYAGPQTKTMTDNMSSLKSLMNEVFTKIIMGQSPVDDFDKFVNDWKKLGGDAITKEVNDWYAANKK